MTTPTPRALILGLNYSPEPTGNAPYTTSLARGLAAAGHPVSVMTAHPHYPQWKVYDGYGGWRTQEVHEDVTVTRLAHYVPSRPGNLKRALSELTFGLRVLGARWHRPDIVLLVSPALLSSAVAMLRLGRAKRPASLVWVQDLYSLGVKETGTGGGRVAAVMKAIESWTLRRATGVIVIHDRFKQYVVNELGVPEASVTVIRNWTHLAEAPPVDRAATRAKFGWRDDEIIVLHAGNQGVKQGLENVIDAARLADERGAKIRFVLLGDGNQRSMLGERAAGIERLQFIPPLPDLEYQHAMTASDILLVNEKPGIAEMAVPSKLTSYFSTGLPVLAATDEGSVTAGEIAASGGGVRVDAGVPDALVEAVLALAADPEHARQLGANGLSYRRNVLSREAAIAAYDKVIRDVYDQRD